MNVSAICPCDKMSAPTWHRGGYFVRAASQSMHARALSYRWNLMKGNFRHFGATLAPKRKKLHLGECRPCVSFMYTVREYCNNVSGSFTSTFRQVNQPAEPDSDL